MKQVFEMVPPSGPAFTALVVGLLILQGGLLALFVYIAHSARNVRFEVSADGLRIRGGLYGRTIPLRDLVIDEATVVDLRSDTQRRLGWRTNGIGLPGYQAGWFRLKNGSKGLAFVTDQTQVVYLPTRQKYALLLSVASPGHFLAALRATAR